MVSYGYEGVHDCKTGLSSPLMEGRSSCCLPRCAARYHAQEQRTGRAHATFYPNIFFIISCGPPPFAPRASQACALVLTVSAWPWPKASAKAGRSAHRSMYAAVLGVTDKSVLGKKTGTS
eukprot:scaffold31811_cov90-Isochrysis_galbana.AAC.1